MKRNHFSVALVALVLVGSTTAHAQSPYLSKVYEFRPAPGQFVNYIPAYQEGDTSESMARKAERALAGSEGTLVSLGSYGGYIVFGFDHMVKNLPGKMDFRVLGNAFYSDSTPNPDDPREKGSSEPGIVMVSYDANGNGKPDDPWYELAGSEYASPATTHSYRITYYRPDENKTPTPDSNPLVSDTTYVRWTDNQGGQGYVARNVFHNQSYYPQWLDEDELTFEGTLLADNFLDLSGDASNYIQYVYPWGYADNHPNSDDRSCFNIDWAVDASGQRVHLPGAHFFKVYTAVNQYCGWLGETSTELSGASDLHLLDIDIDDRWAPDATALRPVRIVPTERTTYYDLSGKRIADSNVAPGIYIEHSPEGVRKVVIR